MCLLLNLPLEIRTALMFFLGAAIGGQLNRGIYRLAWNQRPISPWSAPHEKAPPRRWFDRIPIVGWLWLRREAPLHGGGFWVRPMLIELSTALGLAALYWWEMQGGLLPDVAGLAAPSVNTLHARYLSHVILISLMIVAAFIDLDEQTIPDAITVPGTIAGLVLAAALPASLPPVAAPSPPRAPVVEVDHLLATSPLPWPAWLDGTRGLALGLACYGAWCFAISPWIWARRRGLRKAFRYLAASLVRHPASWLAAVMAVVGWAAIAGVWWWDGAMWRSLFTALIGMAFGGGLIWAVRAVGAGALGKEAMGFGDVTLMAMIGAFLGWQPALMIFFLAPLAALFISLTQWLLTRKRDIAFGPYLCLATLAMILGWSRIWEGWAKEIFFLGWYIPAMAVVCLILMAGMLAAWRLLEQRLFGAD